MAHSHEHHIAQYDRAFAIGIAINLIFVLAEVGFGLASDSLALLADAGHNLSDVFSLLLAWGAGYLGRLPPTKHRTYGWRSSTIMAALVNALLLIFALGAIAWEAVHRFGDLRPVAGDTMIAVALAGVIINAATAWLFMSGRHGDLNIKGAFLHMAADAGVSAGVVAAGVVIRVTGWLWIDPALSLGIVLVIFIGAYGLLKESMHLALQGVPANIDLDEVHQYLHQLPGVQAVHDLHVWAISTNQIALTAHLVKPDHADDDQLIKQAGRRLQERFGIDHTTIQWEREPLHCHTSCEIK